MEIRPPTKYPVNKKNKALYEYFDSNVQSTDEKEKTIVGTFLQEHRKKISINKRIVHAESIIKGIIHPYQGVLNIKRYCTSKNRNNLIVPCG